MTDEKMNNDWVGTAKLTVRSAPDKDSGGGVSAVKTQTDLK